MQDSSVLVTGYVEQVEGWDESSSGEDYGGWRIKVRLDSDGNKDTSELPWAFPALPKMLQSIPQPGEGVFIINANLNRPDSQRYYLGPIISQPQHMEYCSYGKNGRGNALSLVNVSKPLTNEPLASISRRKDLSKGAFPNMQDVALVGRGQEDVTLKYKDGISEIDLRAGIRLKPTSTNIKYMQGNVVFNNQNPGYIQIKYGQNGLTGQKQGSGDSNPDKYERTSVRTGGSVVNVVADKINLISHKSYFGKEIADNENLIKEGELDNIMSQLHRSVYGDELVTLLKKIVYTLAHHTHDFSMKEPNQKSGNFEEINSFEYETILSPNVRIS